MNEDETPPAGPLLLVLLTLERHKDGIWITRLQEALVQLLGRKHHFDDERQRTIRVEVVTLESLLSQQNAPTASYDCMGEQWWGLVNRVSDAAEPSLYKACCAILNVAQNIHHIPVWNGPVSYALCGNKWCHHVLFHKAGLDAPPTLPLYHRPTTATTTNSSRLSEAAAACEALGSSETWLVKPNAGGFGNGIVPFQTSDESFSSTATTKSSATSSQTALAAALEQSFFSDDMALLQRYVSPKDGTLYRVWFLRGRVQCGVERTVATGAEATLEEFSSGCAAAHGQCRRGQRTLTRQRAKRSEEPLLRPYLVPREVRQELEGRLLPLLPDGHSGSVEFLYDGDTGRRLYFDLNLLSTLPLVGEIMKELTEVADYDPWKELAGEIVEFISKVRK